MAASAQIRRIAAIGLLIGATLVFWSGANAQSLEPGDAVRLEAESGRGVPLHRDARSSWFGYAADGIEAVIVEAADNGHWLRIRIGEAEAWILADYAGSVAEAQPGGIDREALLQAACEPGVRRLLEDDLFIICFDAERRIPVWVSYRLTPARMDGVGDRSQSRWRPDDRVEASDQARDADYIGSGFHRGHMAPAEAFTRTQRAVDATHVFTNAVPQTGSVNSGAWSRLEAFVRKRVHAGAHAWVVTGALFLPMDSACFAALAPQSCRFVDPSQAEIPPDRFMSARVAIPSHTFKAILTDDDGIWRACGFIMANIPQRMGSYKDYQYAVDEIESLMGVDLFAALPDDIESEIEAASCGAAQ
ncbi:MAG: DNA/RNA non-specific endonuclease [Euryhalocaulis sp.]|uniref:DNA/RNA non-specific endonuclease n=1 Tax=Euryhalocaulis sp. TaxID=2744307 RepID=UPI0018003CC9|nr:DNA/RNA non-specific endonuclease [Euryhalocaulis sp.]MBA4801337.1 DNA/RNA non-specific endonuclease [Euryhalocaulis sp.]